MKHQENQNLCQLALESIKDRLPLASYQQADELITKYGEWGLGLEFLIDWIGDLNLPLTCEQFTAIEKAMTAMGWNESQRMIWLRKYWNSTFDPSRT